MFGYEKFPMIKSFIATTSTNLAKPTISLSVIKIFNNLGDKKNTFLILKIIKYLDQFGGGCSF